MIYTTVAVRGTEQLIRLPMSSAEALALNYAPLKWQAKYASLFALEAQMRRFVINSREQMLTRIKLAWWREHLDPATFHDAGRDPLLSLLRQEWANEIGAVIDLIDGYENLLFQPPNIPEHLHAFADLVSAAFAQLVRSVDGERYVGSVKDVALVWSIGWLNEEGWLRASEPRIRAIAQAAAGRVPRLPRTLRPFSVLFALARAAIRVDGAPLMSGRASVAVALRAGLLGR